MIRERQNMRKSDFIWTIVVLTTATTIVLVNLYKTMQTNHSVEYTQEAPIEEDAHLYHAEEMDLFS